MYNNKTQSTPSRLISTYNKTMHQYMNIKLDMKSLKLMSPVQWKVNINTEFQPVVFSDSIYVPSCMTRSR